MSAPMTAAPKPPSEFEAWWRSSKYCQVVNSDRGWRQIALDGWNAAILAPSPEAGGELAQELERDLRVVSEIMVGDRPRNTPEGYDAWERVKAAVRASVAPESNAPAAAAFDKMFAGTTPADIPALRSQAPSADAGVREVSQALIDHLSALLDRVEANKKVALTLDERESIEGAINVLSKLPRSPAAQQPTETKNADR